MLLRLVVLWLLFSGLQFEVKVIIPVPMTAGSSRRVAKGAAADQTVMGEMNSGDPACLTQMKPFGAVPPLGSPCRGPGSPRSTVPLYCMGIGVLDASRGLFFFFFFFFFSCVGSSFLCEGFL